MKDPLIRYRALIDNEIETLSLKAKPPNLYEPIRYILQLGGKRFRPVLTLLSHLLFEDAVEKAVLPAIGIEVFHNFTLMHDDIMDKAPLRRGKTTVHARWNDETAILAGDVMLVKAYELIAQVEDSLLKKVLHTFNNCATGVCEGQQIDMDFESMNEVSETAYLGMIRLKTAVLIGFSMELGAIIAGADKKQISLVRSFGENLGMVFQLKDDILDVFGDHEKFGKQVGGDIITNKKTFLWIKACKVANPAQKKALIHWFSMKAFDPEEKIEAITQIYNDLNIRSVSEQKMNAYIRSAFVALDSLNVSESVKHPLVNFTQKLIDREK
ncbi:MAG: polyprenyl synthetase family protein [Bacteroidetes bacterium]|nr:polyprenyl synthetase family protein [Bacteroidota bacterium]